MKWTPDTAMAFVQGALSAAEREEVLAQSEHDVELRHALQRARKLQLLTQQARRDALEQVDWRRVTPPGALRAQLDEPQRAAKREVLAGLWLALVSAAAAAGITLLLWPSPKVPAERAAPQPSAAADASRSPAPAMLPQPAAPTAPTSPAPSEELADGSALVRRAGATLEVRENNARAVEVHLTGGEAEFRVVKSALRENFRVRSGDVLVQVLGTRFTVQNAGDTVRVAVAEGRVRVEAPEGVFELGAGDEQRFAARVASAATQASREAPIARGERGAKAGQAALPPKPRRDAPVELAVNAEQSAAPEPDHGGVRQHTAAAPPSHTPPRPELTQTPGAKPSEIEWESTSNPPKIDVQIDDGELQLGLQEALRTMKDGRFGGALSMLDDLVSAHPQSAALGHALYLRGYCLFQLGRRDEAYAVWKRYTDREPNGRWLRTASEWTSPALPSPADLR
jgi:TolA-binding protein